MCIKPAFTKNDEENRQFKLLKEAVGKRLSKTGPSHSWHHLKCFLLPCLYIVLWYLAISFRSQPALYYFFFSLMGITIVLAFVNLIHEACHLRLFKKKWQNQMMMYLFDFMGANSFIWSMRHVKLHHNYPNTVGWDCDIEQGGPLKIFPSKEPNFMQRFQHYWIFFLYPLFVINWLLVRDFRDFYSSGRYIRKVCDIPVFEHFKLWIFKIIFVSYIVLVPIFAYQIPAVQALTGFILLMFSCSMIGMIILLTPHVNVGNEFPVPNENTKLETTWLIHQFITTNDIKGDNFFSKHLMNNFNHHLAHHLFPNIKASQTAEATAIIKEYAAAHDLHYKSYTLIEAFQLHYRLIKQNAIQPQFIFEEDM